MIIRVFLLFLVFVSGTSSAFACSPVFPTIVSRLQNAIYGGVGVVAGYFNDENPRRFVVEKSIGKIDIPIGTYQVINAFPGGSSCETMYFEVNPEQGDAPGRRVLFGIIDKNQNIQVHFGDAGYGISKSNDVKFNIGETLGDYDRYDEFEFIPMRLISQMLSTSDERGIVLLNKYLVSKNLLSLD